MITKREDPRVARLVARVGSHVITSNGRQWFVLDGLRRVGVRHSLAAAEAHAHRLEVEARALRPSPGGPVA